MNSSLEKLLGWDKKRDEIRSQSRHGSSHIPLANLGLKNAMIGLAHDSIFGNKWMSGGKGDGTTGSGGTAEILGEINERLDAINRTVEDVFQTQENIEVLAQKILHLKSLSAGNNNTSFAGTGTLGAVANESENKGDASGISAGTVAGGIGLALVIKKIYNLIAKKGAKWAVSRLVKRYGLARASLFVGKFLVSGAVSFSGIGTAIGVAGLAWMVYEAYDILVNDKEDEKPDPSVQGTLDIFRDMDKKSAEETVKSRTDQAAGLLGKLEKDSLAKTQSDRLGGFASKFPMKMPQEMKIESKHGKIRFKANEIVFESKNIRGLAGGRPSTPGGTSTSQGTFNPYSQEHSSDEQSMDSRMREMDGRQAPGGSGGGSSGGGYQGSSGGSGGYSGGSGGSSGGGSGSGGPYGGVTPSPSISSPPRIDEKSWKAAPPNVQEYAAPSGPGSFAGQPSLAPFLGQGPSADSGYSSSPIGRPLSPYLENYLRQQGSIDDQGNWKVRNSDVERERQGQSPFLSFHPEGAGAFAKNLKSSQDGPKISVGGSPFLAQLRSQYMRELEADPKLKDTLLALAMKENAADPGSVIESLMNRAAANGKTIRNQMFNGFYGPINRGEIHYGSRISGARLEKSMKALEDVVGGRNAIDLRTDQGMINEHRFADTQGKRPKVQINGEWYSDKGVREERWVDKIRPEMEAYDRKYREEQPIRESKEQAGRTVDAEREETEDNEKGIDVNPRTQAQRPRHLFGSVSLPAVDGFEAQSYRAGSGGGGRGSMPYGSHPVSGTRASGPVITNAVGPTPVWHVGTKQSGYQSLPDPKVGTRTAIQIHKGTDVTKLYSAGCLAIHPNDFKKFSAHMDAVVKKYGSAVLDVSPSPKGKGHTVFAIRPPGTGDAKTITADEAVSSFKRTGHVSVQDSGIIVSESPEKDAMRTSSLADDEEELIDPELEAEEKAEDEKARVAAEEKRNPSQTPTPWSKKGKESKDYTPVVIGPKQEEIGDGSNPRRAEAPTQAQQAPERQPERSISPPAGSMLSETQPPHQEYNRKEVAPPVVPKGTDRPVKKDIYSEAQN